MFSALLPDQRTTGGTVRDHAGMLQAKRQGGCCCRWPCMKAKTSIIGVVVGLGREKYDTYGRVCVSVHPTDIYTLM